MADTRCYINSTVNGNWRLRDISGRNSVCPGTQQTDGFSRCCGDSAICLPNNICQALNPAPGASGFYVGSCTDRDYNSPACSNFCSGVAGPDIIYNDTSETWQCCGTSADGRIKCDDPTKRSSRAPAPTILLERYTASRATFTASSTSITSSPSSTSSFTPAPSSPPENASNGIPVGAKIGAGLGGAVGGLVLLGLIVFLVKWRRKPQPGFQEFQDERRGQDYVMSKPNVCSPAGQNATHAQFSLAELSSQATLTRSELPAGYPVKQSPQELPS